MQLHPKGPLFAVVAGAIAGCAMSNVVKPTVAKQHGATHLNCAPDKVTVSQIDGTTWKAEGCEHSVVLTCWTSVGQGDGTCTQQ